MSEKKKNPKARNVKDYNSEAISYLKESIRKFKENKEMTFSNIKSVQEYEKMLKSLSKGGNLDD